MWPSAAVQRCMVHKLRNLIAHAPKKLHEELTAEYSAMIYADTAALVLARRQAFLRKWRLRCPGVARLTFRRARISVGKGKSDVVDRNLSLKSRGFDSLPARAKDTLIYRPDTMPCPTE